MLRGTVGDGATSFNNLRVTKVTDGLVTMLFDGYVQPPPSNPAQQYIVKVMPVMPAGAALNDLSVVFGGFGDNATGFTFIVNNGGVRVVAATLAALSFMVEVSQYDLRVFSQTTTKAPKETEKAKDTDTKSFKDTEFDKAIKDSDAASFMPADASPSFFGTATEASDGEAAPDGRAFIAEEERPQVGRAAFDLADKQDEKLPESNTTGKQAESFS